MTLKSLAINLLVTTLVIAWVVLLISQVRASVGDDLKASVERCIAYYKMCIADNPMDLNGGCFKEFEKCCDIEAEKLGLKKVER